MNESKYVRTAAELTTALAAGHTDLRIIGTLRSSAMVTLPPGVSLRGGAISGGGLRLTSDNTVTDLVVVVPDAATAITNDPAVDDLGTLTLRRVRTRGRILLRADGVIRAGHIEIDGLFVERANCTARQSHPAGGRIGAITVINRQRDPAATLSARLRGLRVGSSRHPVRGCGVVIGGRSDGDGGVVRVPVLGIDEVHITGEMPSARGGLVEAAVLVRHGGHIGELAVAGPLACHGPHQIAVYNRGSIARCTAAPGHRAFRAATGWPGDAHRRRVSAAGRSRWRTVHLGSRRRVSGRRARGDGRRCGG